MNIRELLDIIGGMPDHTEVTCVTTEYDEHGQPENVMKQTTGAEKHNIRCLGNSLVIVCEGRIDTSFGTRV